MLLLACLRHAICLFVDDVIPVLVTGIHSAASSGDYGWLDTGDKPRYDNPICYTCNVSHDPDLVPPMQIRPRRSVLYMPGSNARALEKAKSIAADALILDLEDAVAPEAKEAARKQVCDAVKAGGYGHREMVIRVNALDTPWGQADLEAAAAAAPDAVLLPKPGTGADIVRATEALARAGAPDKTRLWAMIETPLAILNLAGYRLRLEAAGRAALMLRPGPQRPRQGDARRPLAQPAARALLAVRGTDGSPRLRVGRARRRLQQLQGRRRL